MMVTKRVGGHHGGMSSHGYAKPGMDMYEDDEPVEVVRRQFDEGLDMTVVEPVSVLDVGQAFLDRLGAMSTYKLQKLCFYAQAQYAVWFDTRLFPEPIEAWPNGPAVRRLYAAHAKKRTVDRLPVGNARVVDDRPPAAETINYVASQYGHWTGDQLKELTHREAPWLDARAGLGPREHSDREIPVSVLRDYYRMVATDFEDEVIEGE